MYIYLLTLITLLSGCATTMSPIDVPVDIGITGDTGDVNTSISNSVQNIVSQLEWWHMATIVGLAYLVGLLSPGPLDWIRGFFAGLKEIIVGIRSIS